MSSVKESRQAKLSMHMLLTSVQRYWNRRTKLVLVSVSSQSSHSVGFVFCISAFHIPHFHILWGHSEQALLYKMLLGFESINWSTVSGTCGSRELANCDVLKRSFVCALSLNFVIHGCCRVLLSFWIADTQDGTRITNWFIHGHLY